MTPERALRILLQAGDPIRGEKLIRRAIAQDDRKRARKLGTTAQWERRKRLKSAIQASFARLAQGMKASR